MEAVLLIAVLIFSVVVHEVAHAWQARREGDDTADRLGRITLNPLPHLDPIGSVIVPLVLHFSGSSFLFGWARPVPVNPANYRSPVWGDIRVSMAGIVSNLGLAVLSTFALAIAFKAQSVLGALGHGGRGSGRVLWRSHQSRARVVQSGSNPALGRLARALPFAAETAGDAVQGGGTLRAAHPDGSVLLLSGRVHLPAVACDFLCWARY